MDKKQIIEAILKEQKKNRHIPGTVRSALAQEYNSGLEQAIKIIKKNWTLLEKSIIGDWKAHINYSLTWLGQMKLNLIDGTSTTGTLLGTLEDVIRTLDGCEDRRVINEPMLRFEYSPVIEKWVLVDEEGIFILINEYSMDGAITFSTRDECKYLAKRLKLPYKFIKDHMPPEV